MYPLYSIISFLLLESNRKYLGTLLKTLKINRPHVDIINILMESRGDFTPQSLRYHLKDKIDAAVINSTIDSLPDCVIDKNMALHAVEEIRAVNNLEQVINQVRSNGSPINKLKSIENILQSNSVKLTEPKSKLISAFNEEDSKPMVDLFGYGLSRQDLAIICAFSGLGKTRILLSLLKEYNVKYHCLFISIADWSESKLKRTILDSDSNFTDFYAACFSDCSIYDIQCEIEHVKPEILFVDYLTELKVGRSDMELRHRLGMASKLLKKVAQEYNIPIITAHQLNKNTDYPRADDLSESKVGILKSADLVLGVGGNILSNTRNITTIKARGYAPLETQRVIVDFKEFNIYE